jgi:hypothetical protein
MAAMAAAELDGLLRDQLEQLEAQRPGSARARYGQDQRWAGARDALVSAVTDKTGLPGEFVLELLARREVVRQPTHHNPRALAEAADTAFVMAVMAAAAWTMASAAAEPARADKAAPAARSRGARDKGA